MAGRPSIDSNGGPLVLVPNSLLSNWRGVPLDSGVDPLDPSHDYGRACALRGWLGALEVNGATVVVVGDEPNTTYFATHPSGQPMLVRWRAAESEDELFAAANALEVEGPPDETLDWTCNERDLRLFDSAFAGDADDLEWLDVRLDPGRYTVDTYILVNSRVWTTVHVWKRQ